MDLVLSLSLLDVKDAMTAEISDEETAYIEKMIEKRKTAKKEKGIELMDTSEGTS